MERIRTGARVGRHGPFEFHDLQGRDTEKGFGATTERPVLVRTLSPTPGGKAGIAAHSIEASIVAEEGPLLPLIQAPGIERVWSWDASRWQWLQERFCGWSVAECLARRGALPVSWACAVIVKVCDALHALHALRDRTGASLHVLYRHLDAESVVVTDDQQVKLRHPGFRALGQPFTSRASSAKDVATLAPEQARAAPLDTRTDVYQASRLLFELLTGSPPFEGDDAAGVFSQILEASAPRVSRFRDDVPPEIDALVACGLDKEPKRRCAGPSDLAAQLRHHASDLSGDPPVGWALGMPRVLGWF